MANERPAFNLFKSYICHRIKELGDIGLIEAIIRENSIIVYYEKKWYPECLYLLAMVDYLCRENGLAPIKEYEWLRKAKLREPVYPEGIVLMAHVLNDKTILENARRESIPEFSRFNIVESEVRGSV